jgi:hypothetical protein
MSNNTVGLEQDDSYVFPSHRLARKLRDDSKTPVVLVACGSFSPVTYLHLRMFEMARDYIKQQTSFEIIGGYLSPVNDEYKKPGLLSAGTSVTLATASILYLHADSISILPVQPTGLTCARWLPK